MESTPMLLAQPLIILFRKWRDFIDKLHFHSVDTGVDILTINASSRKVTFFLLEHEYLLYYDSGAANTKRPAAERRTPP